MQKIKFDFEATKERIYAPNSNVPIGAPVDRNGNIANDGNAYGIVLCKETENEKYWVKYNLVVMVAGYCDIIDAQEIWGDEYSAEAIAAMSDITFCDNHELPTGGGGGWPSDLPKPSVGGYGYTEQGEQTVITWDGDTEGKTVVDTGAFILVKVAELPVNFKPNNVSSIIDTNGKQNFTFYDMDNEYGIVSFSLEDYSAVNFVSDYVKATEYASEMGLAFTENGVYFQKGGMLGADGYVSSLTYGTPDTVHKIDEKYLPEGGDYPLSHETWTFTLEDDTTVEKEVVLWDLT